MHFLNSHKPDKKDNHEKAKMNVCVYILKARFYRANYFGSGFKVIE